MSTANEPATVEVSRKPTVRATAAVPTEVQSPRPSAIVATVREPASSEARSQPATLEATPESAGGVRLTATSVPKQAQPTDSVLRLSELTIDNVGQIVEVRGLLTALDSFSAGIKGTLDDGTAAVNIVLWQETYENLAEPESMVPGAALRVTGKVQQYLDELEIIPRSAADLTITGKLLLPLDERDLAQITAADVGQRIQVSGQIIELEPFSQGIKYTLDDGTATCIMLLWENVLEGVEEGDSLQAGARLLVRGEVAEYQGELEIVPPIPYDVEVLATAEPKPVPVQGNLLIGTITGNDVESLVTLEDAGIIDVAYFSKGIKLTLADESGSIVLLLWQNVLEEIPERYDLRSGNHVRVTGVVDQYQGELEIVPRKGTDVTIQGAAVSASIKERATGDISALDEGQIVTVRGSLAEVVGDTWLKLWLDDGSGQVLVYVPQRLIEYMPANLQAGQQLQVTGEVSIYDGEAEIIPLAGQDVERQ